MLDTIVWSAEYEDWPRGLLILYADRKLLTPEKIARICGHQFDYRRLILYNADGDGVDLRHPTIGLP
jgi:hypothetical protein